MCWCFWVCFLVCFGYVLFLRLSRSARIFYYSVLRGIVFIFQCAKPFCLAVSWLLICWYVKYFQAYSFVGGLDRFCGRLFNSDY